MRIDKFLRVSRVLKRRTLAQEATKSGKVLVGGKEDKPSYRLKVGDIVEIKFGTGTVKFVINVPVTRAGTNKRFSSFEMTAAELSGINLNFAKM